jgi:hypothetical protein
LLWLVVSSAAAVVLVAGVALAFGPAGDTAGLPASGQSMPRAVAEQMSAFRRAQVPADKMPGDPVADLEESGDRQVSENPLLARRFDVGADKQAYAWPMADGVCYASPGPAGCVPTALLEQRGASIATSFTTDSRVVRVFGLAVDGVKAVELDLTDGRTVTAPVRGGAFYVELASDPLQARWTMPDGSVATQSSLVMR